MNLGIDFVLFFKKVTCTVHGAPIEERRKLWPCELCDKSFTAQNGLRQHINSHHDGIRFFNCNFCDSEFYTKIAMENHVTNVHEKKKSSFKCAICGDSFELKTKLQSHIESVHGKKVPLDSL